MKQHNMLPFRPLGLGIIALAAMASAQNVQRYCSSDNTGSDYSPQFSIYNSIGLCSDNCRSQYAFAIVQFQNCWCSNYAPGDTTSTNNCQADCPGYPLEKCGNNGSGLFGYVALDLAPSGTVGGSSPTSSRQQSSTAVPSSTQRPETSYTSERASTTSEESTSSTPETTMEPVTSVIVVTSAGAVVTQTITSTPVAAPESNEGQQPIQRSDGISGGAIAGIVIGILAAVAAVLIGAFFLWRRRKQVQDGDNGGASSGGKNLGRNVSVLSKAGLLARTRASMGEKDHDDQFYGNQVNGQNSVRHSMMFAPGASDGISPTSPLGSSHGSDHSRRMSRPMVYDQRLNPSALFSNQEANGSRISMQDTQDYSRPLGIANPDPRPSFESRVSRH